MTEKEQDQLMDKRLVEYSACERTLKCVTSALKEHGEVLEELGKALSENPQSVAAVLDIRLISISNARHARDGIAADKELLSVLELVHTFREALRKKQDLEKFLSGTQVATYRTAIGSLPPPWGRVRERGPPSPHRR